MESVLCAVVDRTMVQHERTRGWVTLPYYTLDTSRGGQVDFFMVSGARRDGTTD